MSLAALGAGESVRDSLALSGELGAAFRLDGPRSIGAHLGFVPQLHALNAYLRYDPALASGSVGGGLRVLPVFSQAQCEAAVGRPWRDANGSLVELSLAESSSNCERRERAGREWQRDAAQEAASVPAFLNLAAELLHARAPLALVERALDAANDEIRHAFLCAALASRYLGVPVHPHLPTWTARAPLCGSAGLQRLAIESFWDGGSSEAAAARVAERSAHLASDPLARRARGIIAHDEHRHAELGFDVLRWALSRRDPATTNAVREQLALAPSVVTNDAPGVEEFGRPSARAVAAAQREAHVTARRRAAAMLQA
jgi:hypothetical protein